MQSQTITKQVVAAIVLREDRVLICQRRDDQPFPLQWEFPGGKIEAGEEPAAALERELEEELGIRAVIGPEIATVRHCYKGPPASPLSACRGRRKEGRGQELSVELRFFLVLDFSGEIENRIFRQLRWEERAMLDVESFLEADRELVRKLKSREL